MSSSRSRIWRGLRTTSPLCSGRNTCSTSSTSTSAGLTRCRALVFNVNICVREMKKEGRKKQGQTNNKAKQHSTPKAVTFPEKNELRRVGLESMSALPAESGPLPCSGFQCPYTIMHVHVCLQVCTCKLVCVAVNYARTCFALFVCLALLASFFLPSHLSFKNMYLLSQWFWSSVCVSPAPYRAGRSWPGATW